MIKKYWRENQHYPYRTERILLEMLPHRKKIEIPNFRNTLQVERLSWLARESWDKLEFAKWFNLTDIWNKVWNFLFWIHSNPPWYFLLSKYKFFKKCSFGLLGRFKNFTRYCTAPICPHSPQAPPQRHACPRTQLWRPACPLMWPWCPGR